MVISADNIRELPIGNGWVMPVKLFFKCEDIIWQESAKKQSHLIIRGPRRVDHGVLAGKPSLWNLTSTRREDFFANKYYFKHI